MATPKFRRTEILSDDEVLEPVAPKLTRKEIDRRYRQSEKGRAQAKRAAASPGAKARRIAWMQTPKGQDVQRRYTAKRRQWVQEEKLRRGCIDCGYNKHAAALDFDHVEGSKRFNISRVKRSLEALRAEIAKCVVRCSNCHRIRTFESRQKAQDKRTIR